MGDLTIVRFESSDDKAAKCRKASMLRARFEPAIPSVEEFQDCTHPRRNENGSQS